MQDNLLSQRLTMRVLTAIMSADTSEETRQRLCTVILKLIGEYEYQVYAEKCLSAVLKDLEENDDTEHAT